MDDEKSAWINKETDETVVEKGGTYLLRNDSVKNYFLQAVSLETLHLKILQYLQENVCAGVYIWYRVIGLRVSRFTKINTPRRVFSGQLCENLKSINFVKHLWMATPECQRWFVDLSFLIHAIRFIIHTLAATYKSQMCDRRLWNNQLNHDYCGEITDNISNFPANLPSG